MHRATRTAYITGFVLSVGLTLIAYSLVSWHVSSGHLALTHRALTAIIALLAVTQLIVQLVLFLHLGDEPKPRWNLMSALFAGMVVLIVVFGSLWIMNHLNYNMMSAPDTNAHIIQDEGIHR